MDAPNFPTDLVQAQRDLNATYDALAAPHQHGNTTLRRHLLLLSARIWWHPFWNTRRTGRPADRTELRRQARGDRRAARAA
ncbi:hypothetical protein BCL80_11539 [Streptomyces avidinii]|uniref:Uncharacterized protein n=1 Tax=Streptomyces glycanivorans TaxID=3033808 RepID=A0ABY9JRG0_9ACTN|nr:hypothetical protein [Streptomyces sp. Alt3]RAS23941.1 hypothetical protein BCL80_11539 [Streptomyces avidinii]WLQ69354.1 hypothetical protein P8A20_38230 [Streptomyces sp. Alt3]SNX80844.1 hypothetical protein SAMN05421860_11339 [Streptomyces microflavus]